LWVWSKICFSFGSQKKKVDPHLQIALRPPTKTTDSEI
jgi:hypothetical protein